MLLQANGVVEETYAQFIKILVNYSPTFSIKCVLKPSGPEGRFVIILYLSLSSYVMGL
jgi:hypothetical protein